MLFFEKKKISYFGRFIGSGSSIISKRFDVLSLSPTTYHIPGIAYSSRWVLGCPTLLSSFYTLLPARCRSFDID